MPNVRDDAHEMQRATVSLFIAVLDLKNTGGAVACP